MHGYFRNLRTSGGPVELVIGSMRTPVCVWQAVAPGSLAVLAGVRIVATSVSVRNPNSYEPTRFLFC